LVAFEAAARHRSLTTAARELRVTQSAVSQQVRSLEQELGVTLFFRSNRGLDLSEKGKLLYRSVRSGLECMAAGVDEIRAARKPSVVVGTTTAIATFWLVPRLQEFRRQHPDIDVSIMAADLGFDAVADSIDAGIVFGRGVWPGFRASYLREGDVFPVCSPRYLQGRPPLSEPKDLLDETLLMLNHDRATVTSWPLWFAHHGIRGRFHRRVKFNHLSLLLQAACEGQGIALGWTLLTDTLLREGALVRPLPGAIRTQGSYYVIVAERNEREEVRLFEAWVLGQVRATSAARQPSHPLDRAAAHARARAKQESSIAP
jgi:DNA-binding transcriptional LysR family regulator